MSTVTIDSATTSSTDASEASEAAEPQALPIAVHAALVPGSVTEVSVRAGAHRWTIDEPTSLGGTDLGANPVEHLLAALGSCTVITYQLWARQLGLAIDRIEASIDGTIDLQGFLGLDPDVRPGFPGLRLRVEVAGPESEEDYRRLAGAVERHCPVLDNLTAGVPVATRVNIAAA